MSEPKYVNLDTVSIAWLSIWTVLGATPVPIFWIQSTNKKNDFHQLQSTILLETSYTVQKSYYTLQFYKILLHTNKSLLHTVLENSILGFAYTEKLSASGGQLPASSSLNVRHKSPPLYSRSEASTETRSSLNCTTWRHLRPLLLSWCRLGPVVVSHNGVYRDQ